MSPSPERKGRNPRTGEAVEVPGKSVPYFKPGDAALAAAVEKKACKHWSMILAHHGPVVAGKTLTAAMHATEELEQTAKLALMLDQKNPMTLTQAQIDDLDATFPPW